MIPEDLRYTAEHEWVRLREGGAEVEVGITHFAQEQLGDIVFVELPAVGSALVSGKSFGVVESVKTVSDLYAPLSGEVLEVNPELDPDGGGFKPELVNEDPYGGGWMLRVRVSDPSGLEALLDPAAYRRITEA